MSCCFGMPASDVHLFCKMLRRQKEALEIKRPHVLGIV